MIYDLQTSSWGHNIRQSVLQIGSPASRATVFFLIPTVCPRIQHRTVKITLTFCGRLHYMQIAWRLCTWYIRHQYFTFTKSHNKIIQIEIGQTLDLTTPQSHINSQRKIFMYILDKKKKPNIIKNYSSIFGFTSYLIFKKNEICGWSIIFNFFKVFWQTINI